MTKTAKKNSCARATSKAKKNTGKRYERLAQQVFQAIVDQESDVETVTVQHDVTLPGIVMKTHQIDVLWRFERAGLDHLVLVQCKDHATRVSQGDMLTFKGVLDDVAGQPRGVFVSRSGFQRGARDFAAAHGITLYELRKPLERDWKGRLRNVTTDVTMYAPDFRNHQVEVDGDWYLAELAARGLPLSTTVAVRGSGELELQNDAGVVIMTINDLANGLTPKGFSELGWTTFRHVFEGPTFLATATDPNLDRIKLHAWTLEVKVTKAEGPRIEVRGDDVVSCILFDVLDGKRRVFGADARPLGKHGPDGDGDE